MPEYLSPGVYVEEIPSAVKPIAGVSTSTAAFVGVVPNTLTIIEENPLYDPSLDKPGTEPAVWLDPEKPQPANSTTIAWSFPYPEEKLLAARKTLDDNSQPKSNLTRPKEDSDPNNAKKNLKVYRDARQQFAVANARYSVGSEMAAEGVPVLCTSFSDFTRWFGPFSTDGLQVPAAAPSSSSAPAPAPPAPAVAPTVGQNQLAHAVYGFFQNGGTRCYVMRVLKMADLKDPKKWAPLEAIEEISLVAAPGAEPDVLETMIDHCEAMGSRFAILDAPPDPTQFTSDELMVPKRKTDYGAIYFPYIHVFDMTTQLLNPDGNGHLAIPPSGHLAGIYSRVDHQRGVFKAPANEVIRGALDLGHQVSRNQQDGLNPDGINCIRFINDNITVWGARTIGGDMNQDLKYVPVRRTLIFLRESIDRGTQWVVFEPNDRSLWKKIERNITAFLTTVWAEGALFGSTPQEAFYVKCDDELNPPEQRDLGRVTTEIGVAIVRPAEFVIFRISQWQGPAAS